MMGSHPRLLAVAVLSLAVAAGSLACGPGRSHVSFVNNERPSGYTAAQGTLAPAAARVENPNATQDLDDDDYLEPETPVADTKAERALVHIHGPRVCSGVVIGPRLVATAQRCLRGLGKGVLTLGGETELRVEIASSSLTWTSRKAKYAVVPDCEESELDVAILVLEEPAPPLVVPLQIVSAPSTGAQVQALGFGHCPNSKPMKERTGTVRSRVAQAIVIDVALCKGDIGGPVVDGPDDNLVGLISRRDEPRESPLKTATIARLDTTWARDLIAQAKTLADGGDVSQLQKVTCQ